MNRRHLAERTLRIAEHCTETARETIRMLAEGAQPMALMVHAIDQKARLDAIRAEPPPWVQRRSVTIASPEVS